MNGAVTAGYCHRGGGRSVSAVWGHMHADGSWGAARFWALARRLCCWPWSWVGLLQFGMVLSFTGACPFPFKMRIKADYYYNAVFDYDNFLN